MICPDCHAEALPFYCAHIRHCAAYQERVNAGRELPNRTDSGSVAVRTPRASKSDSKPCARCGKSPRVPGRSYCEACKRLVASEYASTRNGNGRAKRRIG